MVTYTVTTEADDMNDMTQGHVVNMNISQLRQLTGMLTRAGVARSVPVEVSDEFQSVAAFECIQLRHRITNMRDTVADLEAQRNVLKTQGKSFDLLKLATDLRSSRAMVVSLEKDLKAANALLELLLGNEVTA